MAPITLSTKHQDLLKAYIEVSKSEKPDWTAIANKADFATAKYARDSWTIVKNMLLAIPNGEAIDLSERQVALLKAVIEITKATQVNWDEVARTANFKTSKYARDSWAIVRNKLTAGAGGGTASPAKNPTKTPTKSKGSKETPCRKRKKSEDSDEDEQDAAVASDTPEPKPKKNGRKPKAVKKEAESDAEDDAEVATPKPNPKQQKSRKQKVKEEAEVDGEEDATAATPEPELPGEGEENGVTAEMEDGMDEAAFDAAMFD